MGLENCTLIDLPRVQDPRGNLTFIEGGGHVPFDIGRVFYLYDVPGGATRAGHAHRTTEQFIIAASGSFDVVIDDGFERRTVSLNRSYYGLYLPGMIWREIENFSSNSICLVLASDRYNPDGYIRDLAEFRQAVGVPESP